MDSSPAQLQSWDYVVSPDCMQLSEWSYANSDSHSSASSPESYNVSPSCMLSTSSSATFHSCLQKQVYGLSYEQTRDSFHGSQKTRCRMADTQRQSASEREKMRMRNLSKALHNLRRYLPPSIVPAGQNLTKIETLRLAIRYISHLSNLLGLSEETLTNRREREVRRYNLCPEGPVCCQARRDATCLQSVVPQASSLNTASPVRAQERTPSASYKAETSEQESWLSAPCNSETRDSTVHLQTLMIDAWQLSPHHPEASISPAKQEAQMEDSQSWLSHFYQYQMAVSTSPNHQMISPSALKHHDSAPVITDPRLYSMNTNVQAGQSLPVLELKMP